MTTIKNKLPNINLYATIIDDYDRVALEYKDHLECNEADKELWQDIECFDDIKDQRHFWDYVSDSQSWAWDDFEDNLSWIIEGANDDCIITGQLGLWNGSPTIEPVAESDLMGAIIKCSQSMDDIEIEFNPNDGTIEFTGYHHDGQNNFVIYKVDNDFDFDKLDEMTGQELEKALGRYKLNH